MTDRTVEDLSRILHGIYQDEARRQAGTGDDTVRHPDEYDALPEHTKEYDRVLARYIIERERALRAELDEAQLRSIEARNPGIDLDEVRRQRAALSDSMSGPFDVPIVPPCPEQP